MAEAVTFCSATFLAVSATSLCTRVHGDDEQSIHVITDVQLIMASTYYPPLTILAAIAGVLFLLLHFHSRASAQGNVQSGSSVYVDLDAVGLPSGPFRWPRAIASAIFSLQKNTYDGYARFTKRDRPFLLPNIMTGSAVVVLPPSQLQLTNRPDSEFLAFDALSENFQFQYMIGDPDIWKNVLQFEVVRRKFGREEIIAPFAPQTADELKLGFERAWGDSAEWTEVNGWDTCGRIITRAALKMMIGLPSCRDETLLEASRLFTNALIMAAGVINCFPPFVRPVLGPVLSMRAKYYQAKCQRILIPTVEERIRIWRDRKGIEDGPVGATYPNTVLTLFLADHTAPERFSPVARRQMRRYR